MAPLVPMLGAPTASGKSSVALRLAAEFPLEVVTADAMQVYRGMDIGTAKPSREERASVPHHLLDLVTPAESFSVAQWVHRAEAAIGEIMARGAMPLVVGGTGFYLRALNEGLPTTPPADPQAQAPIWQELESKGLDPLLEELREASPVDADRAQRNPRRVVRAVEILRLTGRPPGSFPNSTPRFRYSLALLEPPMDVLRPRIAARLHQMFADGLVEEVEGLLRDYPRQLTATQAIGYKEVVSAIRGEIDLAAAKERVLLATNQYAKRQLTWFRRQRAAELRLPRLGHEALPELRNWLTGLGWEPRAP